MATIYFDHVNDHKVLFNQDFSLCDIHKGLSGLSKLQGIITLFCLVLLVLLVLNWAFNHTSIKAHWVPLYHVHCYPDFKVTAFYRLLNSIIIFD